MREPVSEFATAPPAPRLLPFVDRYTGYKLAGFAAGLHRGLPSGHMTLIVSIGGPIDVVAQTNPRQQPERYRCVLNGLQASTGLIGHDGVSEGVQIELTPLGSRILLQMPARELWDTALEFSTVTGPVGDALWEQLQSATTWPSRFAVCDSVLSSLATGGDVDATLQRAWQVLAASRGRVPVAALASDVGWSRQHLTRRFVDEFGLGPKLAARVMRFERAHRLMTSGSSRPPLSLVAALCGYTDQPHLNRDFLTLAGCTPTELLAEELPFFQDESALSVGG